MPDLVAPAFVRESPLALARALIRCCPVVEFGLVGATMHQADERASLADMSLLTRIYHSVLDRLVAAAAH